MKKTNKIEPNIFTRQVLIEKSPFWVKVKSASYKNWWYETEMGKCFFVRQAVPEDLVGIRNDSGLTASEMYVTANNYSDRSILPKVDVIIMGTIVEQDE